MTTNHPQEEDIMALALSIVKEGDLNTLTIRRVKELVKEKIQVDESYDEKLSELVKTTINRHIASLQSSNTAKIRKISPTKEKRQRSEKGKIQRNKEEKGYEEGENVYHRLTKACRQLGIGLPINKLKGIEEENVKIAIVREYLREKGVKRDPLSLTEKQLRTLRAKLEHEKELESLDTNNILQDSGKRKTRNATSNSIVAEPQSESSSCSTDSKQTREEEAPSCLEEQDKVSGLKQSKRHKMVHVSDEETV